MASRKDGRQAVPWRSWLFGVLCIGAGVAVAIWGADFIRDNERATGVIVTVFSILAGFLVAVMTLLGDQSMLPGGWKMSAVHRERIVAKMTRQKYLFLLYLVTLAIIFVSAVIGSKHEEVVAWMERIYFGLATTAFLLSFRLPSTLMAIQTDRLDAVIEARRKASAPIDRN